MAYVYFTDDQKQRANAVDLMDFLQRQGEQLVRSGREYRWKRYDSVTVRGNEWFRHSRKEGGRAIDFVQQFYDMSFPDAVSFLLGGESGVEWNQTEKSAPSPRKEFALPEENPDMRRVFAYLIKQRFIDRDVLSHFAHKKLIYEDKQYHNAVFVGLDENAVARHAHKRGTYTQGEPYKGNVEGSDPCYSFHWIGESDTLYVFEAPVDMLSFITLNKQDWKRHSYVTLDGVSEHALLRQLELHPHLKNPVLCLDHDAAGIEATGRLKDILCEKNYYDPAYMDISVLRSEFKDWNEDLKALHGIDPIPAQEHPKLVLLPQMCSAVLEVCRIQSVNQDANTRLLNECEQLAPLLRSDSLQRNVLEEQCRQTVACALISIQNTCRQMEIPVSMERVTGWLQAEYKPHEDRGWLRSKAEDIRIAVRDVSSRIRTPGIRTADEQKLFMRSCLTLALSCVKAQMFLVLEAQEQAPRQEQTVNFTMTM